MPRSDESHLDVELHIGEATDAGYPVSLRASSAAEASSTVPSPLDDASVRELLPHISIAATGPGPATEEHRGATPEEGVSRDIVRKAPQKKPPDFRKELGKRLFEHLLPADGSVRSLFDEQRRTPEGADQPLRIRLTVEAPELASLPWEYLYDETRGDYLSVSQNTRIVRNVPLDFPADALTVPPPMRILGFTASPSDLPKLDIPHEKEQMEKALAEHIESGMIKLVWVEGETWRDLCVALENGEWHVLHFIGHGGFDDEDQEGVVALCDDDGKSDLLPATKLGRLLADENSLKLVLLNSCEGSRSSTSELFSSTATILSRIGAEAVVSMQDEISDRAAISFSRDFYSCLRDGRSVDYAVTQARKYLSMDRRVEREFGTPVLHMRSDDGLLFEFDVEAALALEPVEMPVSFGPKTGPQLDAESRRNLMALLDEVRETWIDGILNKSVYRSNVMDLGMELLSGATESYAQGAGDGPISPEHKTIDVFDDVGSSLLILGEPGSGKTTALLDLTRQLIERVEKAPGRPVPVVFTLSSWAARRAPLHDWFVEELSDKYRVGKRVAKTWLRDRLILPLLDGLDEVKREHRAQCVEVINVFKEQIGVEGMVVCCRLKEYMELEEKPSLSGAIRLRHLSREQVLEYVETGGPRLAALQNILETDPGMLYDARSPLMLSLMIRTYQDLPVEEVEAESLETTALRRKQLMDLFIARMFRKAEAGAAS